MVFTDRVRNLLLALFVCVSCVLFPSEFTYAAPAADGSKVRAEYLRLRNIDPNGNDPRYQGEWESLASRIRALVVQQPLDEDSALLRLLAAEAQLRLYRTRKEQAYLTTARALIEPVTKSGVVNGETRAEALLVAGDVALYAGMWDAAEGFYSDAGSFSQTEYIGLAIQKRAEQRLQGLRNGTFKRYLPSSDSEVPRIIAGREALVRGSAGPIIILDPGHGGGDVGATSAHGGQEKEITLDIARRVKALLERLYQMKVQLTRDDDIFVPLARRAALANRKDGAVFVSLHVNASEKHDADGFEAYYLDNTNDEASRKLAERENGVPQGGAVDDLSFMLSDLIQSGKMEDSIVLTRSVEAGVRSKVLRSHRDLRSLGVKKAPFYVLVGAHMPCSLIEMFFVDNPVEGRKLRDESFRSALAAGIAEGIFKFLQNT